MIQEESEFHRLCGKIIPLIRNEAVKYLRESSSANDAKGHTYGNLLTDIIKGIPSEQIKSRMLSGDIHFPEHMKKGFNRAALTAGLVGGAVCAAKKLRRGGEDGVVSGYGQTVLVTGASGGLGRAYAEEFAKHGFDLVLVARSREKLEAAAKELRDRYNVKVAVVDEDLSDPQGGQRLYDKVKALGIQVDQLVNNAGAGKMSRVIDADVKSMGRTGARFAPAAAALGSPKFRIIARLKTGRHIRE